MLRRTTLVCTIVFFLLAGASHRAFSAPVSYTGHKLVRVDVRSEQDIETLKDITPNILDCHIGVFPLKAVVAPDRMPALDQSGLSYTVLSEDIGPALSAHLMPGPRGADPFDHYMPLDEMISFINGLAAARPDLCQVMDIGDSLQGRDVWALRITGPTGGEKPAVFYHGLQHCREWITGPVIVYLANYLITNYDADPAVRDLVDRAEFYLAPCVNPDGYVYTWTTNRLWRKNRRLNSDGTYGVDLNRNWGYAWGGPGSSGTPNDVDYRGPAPFSEPETQVLSNFVAAHPNLRAYMDYHSYGQLILWPWGYVCEEVDEPDAGLFWNVGNNLESLIRSVHGVHYEQGPVCSTIYQVSGGSVDWVYGDQDVFAFSIELRPTSGFPGFELPESQILPTCEENLPGLLYLTEWAAATLQISFPQGLPQTLIADQPAPIAIRIQPWAQTYQPGTGMIHYRYNAADPYYSLPLEALGGDDYQAVLPPGPCGADVEFYFTMETTTGMIVTEPAAAPGAPYAATLTAMQTIYTNDLSANPNWTTQNQWAWGQPLGLGGQHGGPDPVSGHTGSNVYGYNLDGDYPNNMSVAYLTSAPIDCNGQTGVHLSFWRWLGVEQPIYDLARVQVSNNGSTWNTVWENPATIADTQWTLQEFDISQWADNQPTVYLRWSMGPTDGGWRYCGWNIDDVSLFSDQCPPGGLGYGDADADGDVDPDDLASFETCYGGPDGPIPANCTAYPGYFDANGDGDIDLEDFAEFQVVYTGD